MWPFKPKPMCEHDYKYLKSYRNFTLDSMYDRGRYETVIVLVCTKCVKITHKNLGLELTPAELEKYLSIVCGEEDDE